MDGVKKEVWIIDGAFVCEPFVGGQMLGELPALDVKDYSLIHFTQEQFDKMQEDYFEQNGYYPDT